MATTFKNQAYTGPNLTKPVTEKKEPVITSNFVRGLQEPTNRTLAYVTVFFTLAFLGCLIAFWVYEFRGNRCVFGPSCCYTELSNNSLQPPNSQQVVLRQLSEDNKDRWIPDKQTETLTFPSYDAEDKPKLNSFKVELYKSDPLPTGSGSCYYPASQTDSGFILTSDQNGVSIYLKWYSDPTYIDRWSSSHQIIYQGIQKYLSKNSDKHFAELVRQQDGFIYILPVEIPKSGPSITSNTSSSSTYFTKFKESTSDSSNISLQNIGSATPYSYNPLIDFLQAKKHVKLAGKSCDHTKTGVCCICIEPSSKNLPSCKSVYVPGQGYAFYSNKDKKVDYSKNCSHTYFPNFSGNGLQNVEQLIPNQSFMGRKLATIDCGTDNNEKVNFGPSGCANGAVTMRVGKGEDSKFGTPGKGTDSYTNAYVAHNIFCGGGKYDAVMYDPKNMTHPDDPNMRPKMQHSVYPNVEAPGSNGVITLGFKPKPN